MSKLDTWRKDRTLAHIAPFGVFILWMLVGLLFSSWEWKHPDAPWWRHYPEQWIYPLQTITTGITLFFFRGHYEWKWSGKWILIGALMGVLGIGIWLIPASLYDRLGLKENPEGGLLKWLGVFAYDKGFNPGVFDNPLAYWSSLIMRFIRAVVVIALMEEIFWRGFLMRYLLNMDGDYWKVPFGKASWLSFFVVTLAFVVVHPLSFAVVAFIYGALTYALAVKSKSLAACVTMHGVANLIMGGYAMAYGKFGLW